MSIKFFTLILLILLILFFCRPAERLDENTKIEIKKENDQFIEYNVNIASKLVIRDSPSISGKAISKINECNAVKVINDSNETITLDGIKGSFKKIKTLDSIEGYAFSGYLNYLQPDEINEDIIKGNWTYNKSNFNIIGRWALYKEDPKLQNQYFNFTENYVHFEYYFPAEIDTDWTPSQHSRIEPVGTYSYDGCCTIKIPLEDGSELIFKVININNRTTLMIKCKVIETKLEK